MLVQCLIAFFNISDRKKSSWEEEFFDFILSSPYYEPLSCTVVIWSPWAQGAIIVYLNWNVLVAAFIMHRKYFKPEIKLFTPN